MIIHNVAPQAINRRVKLQNLIWPTLERKTEAAHLLEGLAIISGISRVLRKLALIFLGSVISFSLATQVGSAQPLVAVPSSLSFTIPAEGVDTCYHEKDYEAWIEIEHKDSYLKIRAFCLNNTSENELLRYKLEARKSGKSGTAKSFQAGSVQIPTQEKKCLSQLGFSISAEGHYQIKLEVYKDRKLVAEDSLFYPRILKVHTLPGILSLFSLLKPRHAGERAGSLLSSSA